MPDFFQNGLITTLHDLQVTDQIHLEKLLAEVTEQYKIGLVLPVTAADMRARPFDIIIEKLAGVPYIDTICVVLGMAPEVADYQQAKAKIAPLSKQAHLLWTDGPRTQTLLQQLNDAGLRLGNPGKGRAVWTAFGYLLADPRLKAFVLHDCDIVDYDRYLLARLCLPMAHPSLDFEFCKAYYARVTDQMHGRAVRLLVKPLLRGLLTTFGPNRFLQYMDSFRYPLAGEFAVTATLARSNRIPSDWGLEVGTLAEVYRNTSIKRVCQVDLCRLYEHKHQDLSANDPSRGLMKMAVDIITSIFRTLSSDGQLFGGEHFATLRSAFLRAAQDSVRQYHADALINGLEYNRHAEEEAVEGFASQILTAGELFQSDPTGGEAIPNWTRVLTAFPDFPRRLRQAVAGDETEFG